MPNLDHIKEYIKTPDYKDWTEVKIGHDEVAKLPSRMHGLVLEDVNSYYFEDPRDALMVKLTISKIND